MTNASGTSSEVGNIHQEVQSHIQINRDRKKKRYDIRAEERQYTKGSTMLEQEKEKDGSLK